MRSNREQLTKPAGGSLSEQQMTARTYRDMELLNELTRSPDTTQRELSKRIGVALGLTNLMLRRLAKKGYVKISGTKRSRIRYLITPQGILEKSRLTYEFIQYSLQLYGRVRHVLREQLAVVAHTGTRRVLLYGTGELAEIAFLVIQEMHLELIGVVDDAGGPERFLGYPVQQVGQTRFAVDDWILVASPRAIQAGVWRLEELGMPKERLVILSMPGLQSFWPDRRGSSEPAARPAAVLPERASLRAEPAVAVAPEMSSSMEATG